MVRKTAQLLVMACLPHLGIAAEQSDPGNILKIGYVEFPPFTYTSEQGAATGSLTETTRQVLEQMEVTYEFVRLPAKRLARELVSGRVHLFQGVKNHPVLEEHTLASETQLATIRLCAYSVEGRDPVATKEDLRGKRLITLLGYGYGPLTPFIEAPENGIEVVAVSTRRSAIEMLRRGRADYFLDYHSPASDAMKALGGPALQASPLVVYPTYWIVSESWPNAEGLVKRLDQVYAQIEKNSPSTVQRPN